MACAGLLLFDGCVMQVVEMRVCGAACEAVVIWVCYECCRGCCNGVLRGIKRVLVPSPKCLKKPPNEVLKGGKNGKKGVTNDALRCVLFKLLKMWCLCFENCPL